MYQLEPEDFPMREYAEKKLGRILKYLGEERDFSVTFVTDNEIRALNKKYRDIDAPTDILSFRLADGEDFFPSPDEELGDIFISIDSMKRNADELGVDYNEELERLLLHGVLHLRGMDHKTNDFSTEPMLIEQERILGEMNGKH